MTMSHPITHFVERDGVRIHYLHHPGPAPEMVLIHGLTANAHCFDGLIAAGLGSVRGVLALDQRGRGLSDQPASGYSPAEHAADVIALLDHHGIDKTVICGHSYGGLVALEIANAYPERVAKLVVIDIGGTSVQNPDVFALIKPSLDRLGKVFPSWDEYVALMKAVPYFEGAWGPALEAYFRADVAAQTDGSVRVRTPPEVIQQVVAEAQAVDWQQRLAGAAQPSILIHADGPYGVPGTAPVVLEAQARDAVDALPQGRYVHVPGNHMSMLYGANAGRVVEVIREFVTDA
ncbi:alpha/beta fold hydrolase [Haliangium sp.]|uniref:alpha/beta fold hydrolase n=1 Tax=Haliangium sp. TaxID=2663208 RepID=UPI003D0A9B9B